MTCAQCEDLLAARFDGLLDEAAEREFAAHLAACETCRMALDETRRLVQRLEEDGRGIVPSIASAVMDQIVHEQAMRLRSIGMMKHVARISIAAAVLVGLGITLLYGTSRPIGGRVFAAELSAARKQAENASSATWKVSWYQRFAGPAGSGGRWFRMKNLDQRFYYKAPGLYRSESWDGDGKLRRVFIEDEASRAKLVIDHDSKKATLSRLVESSYPRRGPFERYQELMEREDLRSLGEQAIDGRPANGFRYESRNVLAGSYRSVDFWLDAANKRLVRCQQPGGDLFDAAKIVRDRGWALSEGDTIEYGGKVFKLASEGDGDQGSITSEIAFDVELDDALFSLEPPDGYALNAAKPPAITEKDVLEFMGAVADYYDKTFPDRMPQFAQGSKEDLERLRRAQEAVHQKRGASPTQVKLVEGMDRWFQTGIPGPGPMQIFITQQIAEGSWKYLGKGVRLGDKDRIVCWYRPKGARTYRVIYGDLSVKDVEPEDLPLPVER